MITKEKISVSLVRALNNKPYPLSGHRVIVLAKSDSQFQSIEVQQGEIFFPRIELPSTFDWHGADHLAARINYDYGNPEGTSLEFPWVAKPAEPRQLTIDLRHPYIFTDKWNTVTTQFACLEVSVWVLKISAWQVTYFIPITGTFTNIRAPGYGQDQ